MNTRATHRAVRHYHLDSRLQAANSWTGLDGFGDGRVAGAGAAAEDGQAVGVGVEPGGEVGLVEALDAAPGVEDHAVLLVGGGERALVPGGDGAEGGHDLGGFVAGDEGAAQGEDGEEGEEHGPAATAEGELVGPGVAAGDGGEGDDGGAQDDGGDAEGEGHGAAEHGNDAEGHDAEAQEFADGGPDEGVEARGLETAGGERDGGAGGSD